ncbi:hypothetical protein MPTK1_1g14670 [Marchantia polymorpha subsp. ruderalis]|uniref:Secreted protein n=2 Tax=Marchantia polymorpha TaxID=3197 RepID=A0AAF6AQ73_MARPO|nr:hypothetical protein MARPO_0153s0023 [Marchantia polymorpha]PTQ28857.1 hypothetical protein MARPO_0153s0023 [Marchantia polymorpha]BBM98593.1 hypothetical protein Mp_1g14670 [Marchantia polymorpha subsp. ruderalis]BBM98594.1 hypothetical protein Mp_1g14670 [Marchantia polymorpha subsp. ruderalis]|eukprot:PTQ28856.1 hypothetical protein MARPO_0153s0023 [Marchantia polymorpha]
MTAETCWLLSTIAITSRALHVGSARQSCCCSRISVDPSSALGVRFSFTHFLCRSGLSFQLFKEVCIFANSVCSRRRRIQSPIKKTGFVPHRPQHCDPHPLCRV